MKPRLAIAMILAVLCTVAGAIPARAQNLATISGKVTDKDQPLVGFQVIYKSVTNGRVIKVKTNQKGEFFSFGVPIDTYNITVLDTSGKEIYTHPNLPVGIGGDEVNNVLTIDLTNGTTAKTPSGATVGQAGGSKTEQFAGDGGVTAKGSSKTAEGPKVSKEEVERIKAENAKANSINPLINQATAAMNAKKWEDAEPVLKQMVALDATRWQFFQALGDTESNLNKYDEAVDNYGKGIEIAQGIISGTTPANPKNPDTDPVKAKTGIGQMLTAQGNAYLKLKKNPEAIAAYTKAAEISPTPAVAYFNLCATQYNTGNTEGALAACDKAIAADPTKADAYFIKGSLMMGAGKMDAQGKYIPPDGTAEALNKYLELAPDGAHAKDVKDMLQAIGAKIETSYGTQKKKKP